jgi:hypothetical protein
MTPFIERPMKNIMKAESVTGTNIGLFISVVQHVMWISGPDFTENTMLCHFLPSWFRENRKIIPLTVAFSWLIVLDMSKNKRLSIPSLRWVVQPVAHCEELLLAKRQEAWNIEDYAQMDLGDTEMDVSSFSFLGWGETESTWHVGYWFVYCTSPGW